MKYNLELLRADIRDELEKLKLLEKEFLKIKDKLEKTQLPVYDRSAIGYYLHTFYNGCENIFRSIARFFENDIEPHSWHTNILKRMRLDIPGFRPRVLDDELFQLLNDFRGFRHKFRHSYFFELDWTKEREVALKFFRTHDMMQDQMRAFLEKIGDLD